MEERVSQKGFFPYHHCYVTLKWMLQFTSLHLWHRLWMPFVLQWCLRVCKNRACGWKQNMLACSDVGTSMLSGQQQQTQQAKIDEFFHYLSLCLRIRKLNELKLVLKPPRATASKQCICNTICVCVYFVIFTITIKSARFKPERNQDALFFLTVAFHLEPSRVFLQARHRRFKPHCYSGFRPLTVFVTSTGTTHTHAPRSQSAILDQHVCAAHVGA